MRATYQLLSFFLISCHGFSKEPSPISNCTTNCSNELCQEACNQSSTAFDSYERIDEDANANMSLHCTGINLMIIKHNPGNYTVEKSVSESAWEPPKQSNGSFTTFTNLTAGTLYRYRLYRLINGGITRPEISDWFSTYTADYEPLPVESITLVKIITNESNVSQLRAEIEFEPATDRSCTYNVLRWSGEHALFNFYLKEIKDFRFFLTMIDYEQNNTVSISSSNGNGTKSSAKRSIVFVTPSCLEVYNNLNICSPESVEGLQARHISRHGTAHDILVAWKRPVQEPDNYTIQVDLLRDEEDVKCYSVPGNATEYSIYNLELGSQYEVSILAESPGGTGPKSTIVESIVMNEHTNEHKSYKDVVIGLSILVAILTLIVIVCVQRYKQKSKQFSMNYAHFECLDQKDPSVKTDKKLIERDYALESKNSPLMRDKFELCPDLLKLKRILGSGAYGVVRLGSLEDEFGNVREVAVKMLKDDPCAEDIKNFRREIMMMKSAGQHPNIVSLIGCCTLHNKPLLVVEYCCKGDLQSYLKMIWQNMINVVFDQRARFKNDFPDSGIDYPSNTSGGIEPNYQNVRMITNRLYDIQQDVEYSVENVTAADLLNFARQVAKGMEFLSCNRIVHRDLAARNVLVCTDRIVKISDFGLSRDIYQENLYKKQGNGKLPLKWMAIEALTHQVYTTHSDVWSFGILLWEIVTMGALPYPGIPTDRLLKFLKSGYRMERPSNCGIELYNIMLSCWNSRPQNRPTFTGLKESLDKLLSSFSENKYLHISDVLNNSEEQYETTSED